VDGGSGIGAGQDAMDAVARGTVGDVGVAGLRLEAVVGIDERRQAICGDAVLLVEHGGLVTGRAGGLGDLGTGHRRTRIVRGQYAVLAVAVGADRRVGFSAGYELAVELSGDYFEANAMEVAADTFEIDIPFNGEAAECNIRGTARWRDLDNMLVDIAFGTAHIDGLNLPLATGTRIPVEVNCLPDYGWTCRTGCDETMQDCPEGVENCGSGYFECIDGCCVPAE